MKDGNTTRVFLEGGTYHKRVGSSSSLNRFDTYVVTQIKKQDDGWFRIIVRGNRHTLSFHRVYVPPHSVVAYGETSDGVHPWLP